MDKKMGMIGLGKMGLPLAREMMADGYEVFGYDIDPERMEMLEAAGGHPLASSKELAAHSDITCPIIGARSLEQLESSLNSVTIDLTPETRAEISNLSRTPPLATDRLEEQQTASR